MEEMLYRINHGKQKRVDFIIFSDIFVVAYKGAFVVVNGLSGLEMSHGELSSRPFFERLCVYGFMALLCWELWRNMVEGFISTSLQKQWFFNSTSVPICDIVILYSWMISFLFRLSDLIVWWYSVIITKAAQEMQVPRVQLRSKTYFFYQPQLDFSGNMCIVSVCVYASIGHITSALY